MIILKLCQCLTLSLACWKMAQMTQIAQMCAGDRSGCAQVCMGLHRFAGVYKCSLLCAAILGCKQVCSGVHVCVRVCVR